jgi:Skp family chaperone for outer membrane proteins
MGSAREVQEAEDQDRARDARQAFDRRQHDLEGERRKLEAQIEAMRLELKNLTEEMKSASGRERLRTTRRSQERRQMQISRKAD